MAPNVVIRKDNPQQGQGRSRAISQRTGWEYEHDETDAQIDAYEDLVVEVRKDGGVTEENRGLGNDGLPMKGHTFSHSSTTEYGEGDIIVATAWVEDSPNNTDAVNAGFPVGVVYGKRWVSECWRIDTKGKVTAEEVSV